MLVKVETNTSAVPGESDCNRSLMNDCTHYGDEYKYHHDETNQAQHVSNSRLGRGADDVSLDQ
jgi:hypothetical protein